MSAMPYRHLGRSGLKVSVLSFGSWVTFDNQLDDDLAGACMTAAWEAGVNFFDNGEAYAHGGSEEIMGRVLRRSGWPREQYVVSTKFYWGLEDGPNTRNTLNRKYLMSAIDGSLERFGLDYVDLVFCHRADPETPIDETVRAMHEIIVAGKAHYWGTSEWCVDEIREAFRVADRYGLHRPVMEQPQYNLLHRDRVEIEYEPLYELTGLGLTTWSPLASGLLTGKYLAGVPDDSRANLPGYDWLRRGFTEDRMAKVRALQPIADDLGCTLGQLAIAWCAANARVSTVITGASRVEQVRENLGAVVVLEKLDAHTLARIDAAVT